MAALLLLSRPAVAQEHPISTVHPAFFNQFDCFPYGVPRTQSTAAALPGGGTGSPTPKSFNGNCFTPKGVLKVLVVYAGFDNDNVLTPQSDN
ncbi:hypothetical protein [Hymenobacter gummosus]|uniref:hypothetical protein n=1 Tax=Hymenobacter gummosus TaxID=1776032 RepID=UPI0014051025|nr:hypothetical protein [Hymenobacter gummosus]